ncbi:uncharacterized protein L201_003314 [Kwoniella dendrophila CBS 6074]|uniref:Inner centromere protein ARK-binding domain-containing protein n=1 Tax=Kwoniella dendrophila CBS 6074 TaxID=1295534 RepID=A0AAX4JUB0_9TREE
MSYQPQDMPTIDHYAFNLCDELRRAAVSTLSELEKTINETGYGWLDGYMEQIMDRQNRAPITELMKTPSRTQTVKKTRAHTAADQQRTDKVKGLNARLALSPSTKQNSRIALSPLQPRSLNVSSLSPIPITSPIPIKSKSEKSKSSKSKLTKKSKSKKVLEHENDENSPPSSSLDNTQIDGGSLTSSSAEKSKSSSSSKGTRDAVQIPEEQISKKSNPSKSKSKSKKEKVREKTPDPLEEPIEIEDSTPAFEDVIVHDLHEQQPMEVEEDIGETIIEPVAAASEPVEPVATEIPKSSDIGKTAPIAEPTIQSSAVIREEVDEQKDEQMEDVAEQVAEDQAEDDVKTQPEPESGMSAAEEPAPIEPERKVDPTMPTSFANPPTAPAINQPIRQVRSSWLSKALGANAVPVNSIPNNDTNGIIRKSYAASNQRQSTTVDFSGLRKSLAPVNGLKRKSDHGVEEEVDEEVEDEKRPEKTAKVTIEGPIPVPNYTDALPARTPGPNNRPNMPTKTPSFGSAGIISQPDSLNRSAEPSSSSSVQLDNNRSDIHKVTKALDELREKTAAKEAAKQKAALAASTGPSSSRVTQAKSTGTGFLRGLGSLGAGLLGLGGNAGAEEEAQRLARELEEERLAELELEKLMKQATQPDSTEKEENGNMEIDGEGSQSVKDHAARSTTPDIEEKTQEVPMSPEEEEEMIEEQSVMDELTAVDIRTSMASTQRQASAPVEAEPQSTTPTGSPIRHVTRDQAPVIHDKNEIHALELSAAVQNEQQRLVVEKTKHKEGIEPVNPTKEVKQSSRMAREPSFDDDEEMDKEREDEDEEIDELSEEEEDETIEKHKSSRGPPVIEVKTHRKTPSSSSAAPTPLTMSTSSVATTGSLLGQAQSMAAKALGVKPATGPVKSLQLAAAAARKEQAAAERKAALKEAEVRRQQVAKQKAEEERIRADEERKAKVAELEEKRRLRAEFEKRQKERQDKAALAAKEKADKEKAEREAQAAKLRAAEEEAARKRKMAAQTAALNKSQNKATSKQNALSSSQIKGKEPFRPSKQATLASSIQYNNGNAVQSGKMGPSAFRTAETHQTQSSTMTLVNQNNQNGERKALGPPSRPSSMAQQPMRQSNAISQGGHAHSNILQQSRVALQAQLDEKAALVQSEDIVLPDIASEYSDSDDEDRTKDFIPPSWAESPNLRAALEAQALRNPDELFGPIKPLNMEELFKVRTNKFRARTSSANWTKTGDGLTKTEELEYAKRMGFKPSNLGNGGGSSSSSNGFA